MPAEPLAGRDGDRAARSGDRLPSRRTYVAHGLRPRAAETAARHGGRHAPFAAIAPFSMLVLRFRPD
ncbi:MAG: hypothetical protein DCC67_08115 [Planctomycetota bacterium]|nr:MAG: hypothetical protein DCC67_08115 [Planctomycetota bacterium]